MEQEKEIRIIDGKLMVSYNGFKTQCGYLTYVKEIFNYFPSKEGFDRFIMKELKASTFSVEVRLLMLQEIKKFNKVINKIERKIERAKRTLGIIRKKINVKLMIDNNNVVIKCNNELCMEKGIKFCKGCMDFYCGLDCMREDWIRHKKECKKNRCEEIKPKMINNVLLCVEISTKIMITDLYSLKPF